eukprot:441018_1
MARLLYEAFVFYASKDSCVKILYHGLSIPLLFKTLYCCFNAPTSTTTASSVATEFGADMGIILKFKSSESSEYIRTLDMSLFSCFERESEHLIFETRLHVNDIFIPTERLWIGSKLMNILSLYDLLAHGNIVHQKRLLKQSNQKRLCKLLKSIQDNAISMQSPYAKSLILALTVENDKLWLNIQQIQQLSNDLRALFVGVNDEFGEF